MSEDTIFGKIVRGEIPADVVYESDDLMAFRDINPVAPTHVLIIPKRSGITRLEDAAADDAGLLGRLLLAAPEVARAVGAGDYRLVVNNGSGAGQEVPHLHIHLIGGRDLTWPPG